VINHRLATQPVDVRGVYDERLRLLCRGLLLRNPKRRWGAAEVERWCRGDATLGVSDDADELPSALRPYRIADTECTTASELAVALARHWDIGAKDIARGQIARWLEHELNDYELVRKLYDIREERGLSDDMRLLRFLSVLGPDLPPVWRAMPVSIDALLEMARRAAGDDERAASWLDGIAAEGVLARFANAADLAAFDERWRAGWRHFVGVWKAAQAAEEAWRKEPKPILGVRSAQAVSIDDLMFAAPPWLAPPPQRAVNGPLLLALNDPRYVEALRAEVATGRAEIGGYCSWYEALCVRVREDPVGALVANLMLTHARDDAAMEKRRVEGTEAARVGAIGELRERLRARLDAVAALTPTEATLDLDGISALSAALSEFLDDCREALSFQFTEAQYVALCRAIDKLTQHAYAAERALRHLEEIKRINAIFVQPQRLAIGAVVLLALFLVRRWFVFIGIGVLAAALWYRWHEGSKAQEAALSALRLLRLHGKTLLRADEDAAEGPGSAGADDAAAHAQ
jgi:hypothetical protein